MSLLLAVFFVLLFSRKVQSLSVCDDIDVVFLVDEDSLINNMENVLWFMQATVEHGSSEYSAFSTYVYGGDVSYDAELELAEINLLHTFDTYRTNKSAVITTHFKQVFEDIISSKSVDQNKKKNTIKLSLKDAFFAAVNQQQPLRTHKKRARFNTKEYKINNIGARDDENRYFIFDYYGKIFGKHSRVSKDVCKIFEYMDDKDDESIHFILGQLPEKMYDSDNYFIDHILNSLCDEEYAPKMHEDLFFYLRKENDKEFEVDASLVYNLLTGAHSMEAIFHLTCPSHMKVPSHQGSLHLTPHSQWIDPATIIECHLKYMEYEGEEANTYGPQFDPLKSYIYVNDYTHDDNTFKMDDFLLAETSVHEQIQKLGCDMPIYKIVAIEHIEQVKDYHNILKLSVMMPESPMEYIASVDMTTARPHTHESMRTFQRTIENVYEDDSEDESRKVYQNVYEDTRRRMPIFGKDKYDQLVDLSDSKEVEAIEEAGKMDEKDNKLWEETFTKHMAKKEEWTTGKTITVPILNWEIVATSEGHLKADFDLTIHFDVNFQFQWAKFWLGATKKAAVKWDIIGWWKLEANFEFKISGTITLSGALIPQIGETLVVPAGPVPIVIKPYFKTMFEMKSEPIFLKFNVDCKYKEHLRIGYDYYGERTTQANKFEPVTKSSSIRKLFRKASRFIGLKGKHDFQTNLAHMIALSASGTPTQTLRATDKTTTQTDGIKRPWIWTRARDILVSKCDLGLTFANDKTKKCDVTVGFTLTITPSVGVTLYGAINVDAGLDVIMPIGYRMVIDKKQGLGVLCPNLVKDVCKAVSPQPVKAEPYFSVQVKAKITFQLFLPNIVASLKEYFVLKKMYKDTKSDYEAVKQLVKTQLKQKARNCIGLVETALGQFQATEKKGMRTVKAALTTIVQLIQKLVIECYNKDEGAIPGYTQIKSYIDKLVERKAKFEKVLKTAADVIKKPFKKHTFEKEIRIPKTGPAKTIWTKKFESTACKDVPSGVAKTTFLSATGNNCCKGFTGAHTEAFDDWYVGYDQYIEDNQRNEYGSYGYKKHMNSAPIVNAPQSSNKFVELMLLELDVFVLFIIMTCITGCICLACGAWVFYNYNKLQEKKAEYNIIPVTQNDEKKK
eukprot:254170_1